MMSSRVPRVLTTPSTSRVAKARSSRDRGEMSMVLAMISWANASRSLSWWTAARASSRAVVALCAFCRRTWSRRGAPPRLPSRGPSKRGPRSCGASWSGAAMSLPSMNTSRGWPASRESRRGPRSARGPKSLRGALPPVGLPSRARKSFRSAPDRCSSRGPRSSLRNPPGLPSRGPRSSLRKLPGFPSLRNPPGLPPLRKSLGFPSRGPRSSLR